MNWAVLNMCFFVGMLGKQSIRVCQFIMELYAGKYIHIPLKPDTPSRHEDDRATTIPSNVCDTIESVLISGMTSSPVNLLVRHMVWIQHFSPTRPTA